MAIYQGNVATDGSTKIVSDNVISLTVLSVIINNTTSNYNITANIYRASNSSTVPIYSLQLNSGDSVRDSQQYILYTGDYFQLISNVTGTTYYITTS